MKIVLRITAEDGSTKDVKATLPYKDANFVEIRGHKCKSCAYDLIAQGQETHTEDDRVHVAPAACANCGIIVGQLRVTPASLFGIEEDERVLNSRYRVY